MAEERGREHGSRSDRQVWVSALVGVGVFLVAVAAALLDLPLGGRNVLAFALVNPTFLAGFLVFAVAAICLGVMLSRRQWTMAILAGIAMGLGASCAAVTWHFGGKVRDLTPVVHMRLGADEPAPESATQVRDNHLPLRN